MLQLVFHTALSLCRIIISVIDGRQPGMAETQSALEHFINEEGLSYPPSSINRDHLSRLAVIQLLQLFPLVLSANHHFLSMFTFYIFLYDTVFVFPRKL